MSHRFEYSPIEHSPTDASQPDDVRSEPVESNQTQRTTFRISPLIRLTLHSLYGSLLLPLPVLAYATDAPVHPAVLSMGILFGWVGLYAALAERVVVSPHEIRVMYPDWVPKFWRKGWTLPWSQIKALKPRSTGQGGIVYYFLSEADEAYLLPMRVAGFAHLVQYIEQQTDIDMTDVRPLSQPWMYLILLVFTLFLWLTDSWTIWTALWQ